MESLPEGCLAKILSSTTPLDICRLSLVSSSFRSAADSDTVWDAFLPLSSDSMSSLLPHCSSKKELFFKLCHSPIIFDDAKKSFWLDKWTGKKCYMLAARDLWIVWGDVSDYWSWISLPESRFPEVAELKRVWWFHMGGNVDTSILSSFTNYAAYLVFKLRMSALDDLPSSPIEVSVGICGTENSTSTVCIVPLEDEVQPSYGHGKRPIERSDGWLEVELGKCFIKHGENEVLEMSLRQVDCAKRKSGLIVQGIEIRPKVG